MTCVLLGVCVYSVGAGGPGSDAPGCVTVVPVLGDHGRHAAECPGTPVPVAAPLDGTAEWCVECASPVHDPSAAVHADHTIVSLAEAVADVVAVGKQHAAAAAHARAQYARLAANRQTARQELDLHRRRQPHCALLGSPSRRVAPTPPLGVVASLAFLLHVNLA